MRMDELDLGLIRQLLLHVVWDQRKDHRIDLCARKGVGRGFDLAARRHYIWILVGLEVKLVTAGIQQLLKIII